MSTKCNVTLYIYTNKKKESWTEKETLLENLQDCGDDLQSKKNM